MNHLKKKIHLMLVIVFIIVLFPLNKNALAYYKDVSRTHWALSSFSYLESRNILPVSQVFNGRWSASRRFVFEIIYNVLTGKTNNSFSVKMDYLVKNNLVKGRGSLSNLDLDSTITRYETAVVMQRISKYFNVEYNRVVKNTFQFRDVSYTHWARPSIEFVYAKRLMKGYPDRTFRGRNKITRYETAVLFARLLKNLKIISGPSYNWLVSICERIASQKKGYRLGVWDCSLFVQEVFRELGVTLPRTSKLQSKKGNPVIYSSLKRGDLVFFDFKHSRPYEVTHVGVFIGEYKNMKNGFFHNSVSAKKVVPADLSDSWAKKRFLYGRRL
ncbi:C40 family peptidase [bacterium]|nr:C40 family peptidase [bacterium]